MLRKVPLIFTILVSTQAWAAEPAPGVPSGPTKVIAKHLVDVGLDPDAIDKSADPCGDFYQFACGRWNQKTAIPGDEPSWYRSFDEIQKRNEAELRSLLNGLATPPAETTQLTETVGVFWGACNRDLKSKDSGDEVLRGLLAAVAEAKDKEALARVVADLQAVGIYPFFGISADTDYADATQVILWLDQGGLGLPDRDDYLRDDTKSQALRSFYRGHLQRMLAASALTAKAAQAGARQIMDLETALARISKTRVARRDPAGLYNRLERSGLKDKAASLPWDVLLSAGPLAGQQAISVTSVEFFVGLSKLWAESDLGVLKTYVRWHTLRGIAPQLGLAWQREAFALVQQISGQAEDKPVWRRCLEQTDANLGELLAQGWTERRFGPEAQEQAERMVHAIVREFTSNLNNLEWMDPETRQRAATKAQKMAFLIGRPAKWRTYDWKPTGHHAANVLAGRRAEVLRILSRLGKPVDRQEWLMTPPTVNAYYDPFKNQMVFPAGILQPPFFDPKASIAVNLGAIGMVIGHELSHGFDDEGSQFDELGNLAQWWKPQTRKDFEQRTACVVRQYDGYAVQPNLNLNGKLTLGENIADMGGLKVALAAYRQLARGSAEQVVADGYDPDQQFFLANAQAWCGSMRPEMERLQVQTNPHSTARWRVNGPMSNLPDFAKAWKCKTGSAMAPAQRCQVW